MVRVQKSARWNFFQFGSGLQAVAGIAVIALFATAMNGDDGSKTDGAKSGVKAQSSEANNPFLTPVEKAAAATVRTWSDRNKKFSLEATLVRVEHDNAVLKRASDGGEVSVPIDKLCEADQKVVANFKSALAAEAAGPNKADADPAEQPAAKDAILKSTDYLTAPVLTIPENSQWKYKPDPAPAQEKIPSTHVLLKPPMFFEHAAGMFLLPAEKKMFLVSRIDDPRQYATRVQACNLQSGKIDASGIFGYDIEPCDISPDGKLVLANSIEDHGIHHRRLGLFTRNGSKVEPICAWEPYATDQEIEGHPQWMRESFEIDVMLAAFVDQDHIVTRSMSGEIVLWHIPDLKPIYRSPIGFNGATLSGGHKYLLAKTGRGIVILNALDGSTAGTLFTQNDPKLPPAIAAIWNLASVLGMRGDEWLSNGELVLRNDGLRLAIVGATRIQLWDLAERKLLRDFTMAGLTCRNPLWVAENLLLVGGQVLIDVDRQIPVWKYPRQPGVVKMNRGRVWFIDRDESGKNSWLTSAEMPDKAIVASAAKLNPDDFLVVRPGQKVVLDLQSPGTTDEIEAAKKSLAKQLEMNGIVVADQADLHLVGKIQSGESVTVKNVKLVSSGFFGQGTDVTVTPQVLTLSYEWKGEVLWTYKTSSAPATGAWVKQGESASQALQNEMQRRNAAINAGLFADIRVPKFVARMPKAEATK